MCDMTMTQEQVNRIIKRLEDAIQVCYTAPENPKEQGYPFAAGYSRAAMQDAVQALQRLM